MRSVIQPDLRTNDADHFATHVWSNIVSRLTYWYGIKRPTRFKPEWRKPLQHMYAQISVRSVCRSFSTKERVFIYRKAAHLEFKYEYLNFKFKISKSSTSRQYFLLFKIIPPYMHAVEFLDVSSIIMLNGRVSLLSWRCVMCVLSPIFMDFNSSWVCIRFEISWCQQGLTWW